MNTRAFLAAGLLAVAFTFGAPAVGAPITPPRYTVVTNWPALPAGFQPGQPSGVGVDSHDNIFVFHRAGRTWTTPFPGDPIAEATVLQLDSRSGRLLGSWGGGEFIMPHGLTVDGSDNVWLTDVGRHQVFKFTRDGKPLLTLGERGSPGADQTHFNLPTDVAVLPDGSFFVSDGYKNTRVVKFSASGRYEFEWGGKGAGPGEFNLPHGIVIDSARRVIVCDRTNARLQLFDLSGRFLTEWKGAHIGRPYGVAADATGRVLVADGGNLPGAKGGSRAVILDAEGNRLADFSTAPGTPNRLSLAHDIAVARDGSVYVADSGERRVVKYSPEQPGPSR